MGYPGAYAPVISVDEGIGPRFHAPLRSPADFDALREVEPERELGYRPVTTREEGLRQMRSQVLPQSPALSPPP